MHHQLDQSQWWPREKLEARQFDQLREILAHAAQTVPFYRERLAAGIDPARAIDPVAFARLPLLTRRDIQTQGAALMSHAPPPGHGQRVEHVTSGSIGEPLRVFGTQLDSMFWLAQTLRDHLWHRRDFAGTLCAIRSRVMTIASEPGWGPATDALFATGPRAILNIRADPARQLEWLQQHDPAYLLSHPTNLRELARLSLRQGVDLPRLKEVRSFGETLPQDLRALCREAWNASLTDVYSAEEVGYIALQCPEHEHYHVQSEHLLVEVLDDQGRACGPGEIGRVVVTTLHNFAMPLIRYALSDYAEVGAPCSCGRGLPVLTRILGRSRNMLTLPDGRRVWPTFPAMRYSAATIRQLQIIQHTRDRVEARFVAERVLLPEEEQLLVTAIHDAFGYPFAVTLTPVPEIARSAGMKCEDMISLVAEDDVPDK